MTHGKTHYTLIGLQITVALILLALFLSLYKYTEGLLIEECHDKATRDLERIQLTIQREMLKTESAGKALCALQFGNGLSIPNDSDQIYTALEDFLSVMPNNITGAIVGFEDGVLPQFEHRWGFMPLVRHVGGEYIRYQMGGVRDVRTKHDWYRETKRLDCCRWAQPQLAEDGEVICGYCMPLHDANQRFIGVLEIDFSLERLSQETCNIRSYAHSEPMVIDSDLTILISPDRDIVLKENMISLLGKRGLQLEEDVFQKVRRKESGSHHLQQGTFQNPHDVFLFHSYEPHSGWTIQMTCFIEDVYQSLTALKVRMSVIALTIISLMLLVALTFMRREHHHSATPNTRQ